MDHSPLGRLPPEVRNRIYDSALKLSQPITVLKCSTRNNMRFRGGGVEHPAALLDTCRSIRHEATQLFYANNSFVIDARKPNSEIPAAFRTFKKRISRSYIIMRKRTTLGAARIRSYTRVTRREYVSRQHRTECTVSALDDFEAMIGEENTAVLHSVILYAGHVKMYRHLSDIAHQESGIGCLMYDSIQGSVYNPTCKLRVRIKLSDSRETFAFGTIVEVGIKRDAQAQAELLNKWKYVFREVAALRIP